MVMCKHEAHEQNFLCALLFQLKKKMSGEKEMDYLMNSFRVHRSCFEVEVGLNVNITDANEMTVSAWQVVDAIGVIRLTV